MFGRLAGVVTHQLGKRKGGRTQGANEKGGVCLWVGVKQKTDTGWHAAGWRRAAAEGPGDDRYPLMGGGPGGLWGQFWGAITGCQPLLEGLPVDGTCSVLFIFPLRHPHLLKGVQWCQDGASVGVGGGGYYSLEQQSLRQRENTDVCFMISGSWNIHLCFSSLTRLTQVDSYPIHVEYSLSWGAEICTEKKTTQHKTHIRIIELFLPAVQHQRRTEQSWTDLDLHVFGCELLDFG